VAFSRFWAFLRWLREGFLFPFTNRIAFGNINEIFFLFEVCFLNLNFNLFNPFNNVRELFNVFDFIRGRHLLVMADLFPTIGNPFTATFLAVTIFFAVTINTEVNPLTNFGTISIIDAFNTWVITNNDFLHNNLNNFGDGTVFNNCPAPLLLVHLLYLMTNQNLLFRDPFFATSLRFFLVMILMFLRTIRFLLV
jgi:hypothetical protein